MGARHLSPHWEGGGPVVKILLADHNVVQGDFPSGNVYVLPIIGELDNDVAERFSQFSKTELPS